MCLSASSLYYLYYIDDRSRFSFFSIVGGSIQYTAFVSPSFISGVEPAAARGVLYSECEAICQEIIEDCVVDDHCWFVSFLFLVYFTGDRVTCTTLVCLHCVLKASLLSHCDSRLIRIIQYSANSIARSSRESFGVTSFLHVRSSPRPSCELSLSLALSLRVAPHNLVFCSCSYLYVSVRVSFGTGIH